MLNRFKAYEVFIELRNRYSLYDCGWYCGAYINKFGELCIKYIESLFEKSLQDNILTYAEAPIRFEKGRYSYQFLSDICKSIINNPDSVDYGIVGAGVDEKNDRIILAVTCKFRDEKKLYGNDMFFTEHFEWIKTDSSIQPADILTNGKCYFTAGYPAKNSDGICGVVTAGHLSEIETEMPVLFNKDKIGVIRDFEFSEVMDAAFIELDSSCKCSDIVSVAPNPHISGLVPEFISGTAVEMYSQNTNSVQTGYVAYPSFDFMNYKNIVVFSYSSVPNDSGAPVLVPFPSGKHGLAGIHLGTFSLGGRVYAFGRKAEDINSRFSLELNSTT